MLEIRRLVTGTLRTNCYLISNKKTKETLIVDPGDDSEYIESVLLINNLRPKYIVASHGHFDHILASFSLQNKYNIPFLINKKDKFLLDAMQKSAKYFSKLKTDPKPKINEDLGQMKTIKVGGDVLDIIKTPGHTPGSVCLYNKSSNFLIVGDLLFEGSKVGRYDHKYSSREELSKSIKKIKKFPIKTVVYPGHGNTFLLASISPLNI